MLAIVNLGVVHYYSVCTVSPFLEAAQEELILPGSMALKGRTFGQKPGHVTNSVSLLPNLRLLLLIPAPTLVTSLKWTEEEVSAANWICWHESNTQVLLLEMEESCHLKLRSWEHYCNTVQKSSRKKRPQYYCTVSNIKVLDSVRMLLDTRRYQAGS